MNLQNIECINSIAALNDEALDSLISKLNEEKERRKNNRRRELIETVCDAMNELHKEFPYVELCVPFYCSDCEYEDNFDVLGYFRGELKYNDFSY